MLTEDDYCDPNLTPIAEVTILINLRQNSLIAVSYCNAKLDYLCDQHNILITGGFVD